MNPRFSLVIPALNCRATLELVLRCLQAQDFPRAQFECLVVDDGSRDGTTPWLKNQRFVCDVRVFTHPVNQGRSWARNTACKEARGEILLFLDADMLAVPGLLAAYAEAFDSQTVDVVSGTRRHLNLGSRSQDGLAGLARLCGCDYEHLLCTDVHNQFGKLHTTSRPALYPHPAMQKFEEELPGACRKYPGCLLGAYSVISSNVAVRRSFFERVGGFNPALRRGEDTELGMRLWRAGARFGFASRALAYHLYYTDQGDRVIPWSERLAFYYRHPYRLAFLIPLWLAYQDQPSTNLPSPVFDSLISLAGEAEQDDAFDLEAEFQRIYKQPLPARCCWSREFMLDYFCEHDAIDRAEMAGYLDRAVEQGLLVRRRQGRLYFDFNHTINWLRSCTAYQKHVYLHTRYGWLREKLNLSGFWEESRNGNRSLKIKREPLAIRCHACYEISIPREALSGLGSPGSINLPLPVEHACQKQVRIIRFDPPVLREYLSSDQSMILQFPLERDQNGEVKLGYEFTCTVYEHLGGQVPGLYTSAGLAEYLAPTYPAARLPKAEALLKKIFPGPVDSSWSIAKRIYDWMLVNTEYLQTDLNDYLIMETGFGPCIQRARLFVNLCRLMCVPAREQCGGLFGHKCDPVLPGRIMSVGRAHNIYNHSWAEFFTPEYGWVPVEFTAYDLGERILTAVNITDEKLRQQIKSETGLYDSYYFGNVDPFRFYTTPLAGKLPTYPVISEKIDPLRLEQLRIQTHHRLVCDFYPAGQEPPASYSQPLLGLYETRPAVCTENPVIIPVAGERADTLVKTGPTVPGCTGFAGTFTALLTSFGSTGDAQPIFALAEELRRHGHRPIVALAPQFEKRALEHNFTFRAVGSAEDMDVLREVGLFQMLNPDPVAQVRYFLERTMPLVPHMLADLQAAGREADVVVCPPFHLAGRMMAELASLPFVSLHLSPFGARGSKAGREVGAPLVNAYRHRLGLAPLADPLGVEGASERLALFAVSPRVFRRPADWPAHFQLTGYFFLDEPAWEPPRELAEFLESGDPPVVIGFGSMPCEDPPALTSVVLEALAGTGYRAVLQRGGANLGSGHRLPAQVLAVDFVPHNYLFPRAACVVHHGGAGTTAAVFRAGVPAVVVPHLLDQPLWGEYARALGTASASLPMAKLTAAGLEQALHQALMERYRRSARTLGAAIRAENGVGTARQLITRLLGQIRAENWAHMGLQESLRE